MSSPILLFLGTESDKSYSPRLKPMVGSATVYTLYTPITTLAEVILYCKKRNITGVFSTNTVLLAKLVATLKQIKKTPSLDNYAGSLFNYQGIEFTFVYPLEQLVTVPYGSFVTRRFISKLVAPQDWKAVPDFNWTILTASNAEAIFESYKTAFAIAVDIETVQEDLRITCIGYTAIFYDASSGRIHTHSCVLPIDSMFAVSWMRKFNWELKAPKIGQNFKYDISYLLRYNAPVYNWLWDTVNMFHCWYCELPKDLAFLGSFFIRSSMYWKDLADTSDLHEYYRYNALDTHGTALVFIAWMLEAPEWARKNYLQEFPVNYPSILCEATGIKRDMPALGAAAAKVNELIVADNVSLSRMVGTYPAIFNVNSAPQNAALRKILGCSDISSSDEKSLKKIGSRHPLNRRITDKILDLRGNRKLASTYLVAGKELNGRILYAINPHGTETGRCASREHHFWCGLQVQNIPRGPEVKCTLIADEGFVLAEVDLEQAESRDTAYISGDSALIAAVSSERDFHSINASAFFGVPYALIYSEELKKTLDKVLRDLAKRVNHGANYLMGWAVLVDTMTEEKVWEAKRLLKLPKHFGLRDIAEYLLAQFHKTYPSLSGTFYPGVVSDVMVKKMLVSQTHHHKQFNEETGTYSLDTGVREVDLRGWARYCFGNPTANKLHKNAYVAHVPQSLNAKTLNEAFLRVFYDIAINPKYADNFKLLAQIHDSILFQFRVGHEYLADMVRQRMEIPVTIRGYDGIVRTFTVPAAVKAGKEGKGAMRWSETE